MPNGKPGDHPITDFTIHGFQVFPKDIEEMLTKLRRADPNLNSISDVEACDWKAGRNLEQGRRKIKELLAHYKIT
jgi:hypothetical protein